MKELIAVTDSLTIIKFLKIKMVDKFSSIKTESTVKKTIGTDYSHLNEPPHHWAFVIEVCIDCHKHSWNTRHDEKKYMQLAEELAETLKNDVEDALE